MIPQLILAFIGGMALAALHLGGLWWSTRRLTTTARPAVALAIGGLIRLGVTLGGFFAIVGFGPAAVVAALAGFVLVRLVTVRRVATMARA